MLTGRLQAKAEPERRADNVENLNTKIIYKKREGRNLGTACVSAGTECSTLCYLLTNTRTLRYAIC